MAKDRWYPTVTLLGDGTVMVSGGSHNISFETTYEVYDPATNSWQVDPSTGNPWFPGPPLASGADFTFYPRLHVLSDGTVVKTGARPQAAKVDHLASPGVWQLLGASSTIRHDGASVLFPVPFGQQDLAVILGGEDPLTGVVHASTEYTQPKQAAATWAAGPSMNRKRGHLNTVILPDGTVLSAGGDNRDWDYQLFYPPYFDLNRPRPTNVTAPATMGYSIDGAGPYTATFSGLPSGVTLSKAVLMAPASTTHHSDMHQRAADLLINSQTSTSVTFHTPWDRCVGPNPLHSCAPPGYYMLFLVTSQGVPSRAVWVLLQ